MAVVLPVEQTPEHGVVIDGRPDFIDRKFGVTLAKKFPPYVFSITCNSALVHRMARVEIHWWAVTRNGHGLAKLTKPVLIGHTICGQTKRLNAKRSRTCMVPAPDAVLCGRCHGEPATFGKDGAGTKSGLSRHVAYTRLGCTVNGYPTGELAEVSESHGLTL